jgi:hypothetical protein
MESDTLGYRGYDAFHGMTQPEGLALSGFPNLVLDIWFDRLAM